MLTRQELLAMMVDYYAQSRGSDVPFADAVQPLRDCPEQELGELLRAVLDMQRYAFNLGERKWYGDLRGSDVEELRRLLGQACPGFAAETYNSVLRDAMHHSRF